MQKAQKPDVSAVHLVIAKYLWNHQLSLADLFFETRERGSEITVFVLLLVHCNGLYTRSSRYVCGEAFERPSNAKYAGSDDATLLHVAPRPPASSPPPHHHRRRRFLLSSPSSVIHVTVSTFFCCRYTHSIHRHASISVSAFLFDVS